MISLRSRFAGSYLLLAAVAVSFLVANIALAAKPTIPAPGSEAKTENEMKPYTDTIPGSVITFTMLPIPGGTYMMGSPASEASRGEDEGPQHETKVGPFWMGKCEVTWDEYEEFMFNLDIERRKVTKAEPTELDKIADTLSRPTKPYTDMTFGLGKEGNPAISMTQHAARKYCEWLSAKTGRYYRLPTEAEWEYACRAGTKTVYSFGDDSAQLGEYAWFYGNSNEKPQPVGKKKPNAWGLHDMHGNVAEWCADGYEEKFYEKFLGKTADNPLNIAKQPEPCVARGGGWDADADRCRSASRLPSHIDWKMQDPQLPQSVWYYTDAQFIGFRVVRPLVEPSDAQKKEYGFEDTSRK